LQIFGAGSFAQHLLNRVAGHDVREQKNHRENQPERREGEKETERDESKHLRYRPFGCASGKQIPLCATRPPLRDGKS
jgi:hypothetical protein